MCLMVHLPRKIWMQLLASVKINLLLSGKKQLIPPAQLFHIHFSEEANTEMVLKNQTFH